MSVSLKAEKSRAGLNVGLGSSKWKKHRNVNGPVRLSTLPNYATGFQKMGTEGNPSYGERRRDVVLTESMNNPVRVTPWGGVETTPQVGRSDPFNEQLSSVLGSSYQTTSLNANQYFVRKNPGAAETIRLKVGLTTLSYSVADTYTRSMGLVVATYPSWELTQNGAETVVHNYVGAPLIFDQTITLPANDSPIVVISIQHTVGGGDSSSKKFGMGIHDFRCEYV
tara:strand:- start:539 stop:1210 length:672 start_codon:yes stop_codon:yes gene_type:complete